MFEMFDHTHTMTSDDKCAICGLTSKQIKYKERLR